MMTPAASPPSPSTETASKATNTSPVLSPAARICTRTCPGANTVLGVAGSKARLLNSPLPVVPNCHCGVAGTRNADDRINRGT